MIVLFAPVGMLSVLCDGCAGAVSVLYYFIVCHLLYYDDAYYYYLLLLLTMKLRFQQASWLLIWW